MAGDEFDLIGVGSPIVDCLAHVDDAFLGTVAGEKGGMVLVGPSDIAEMMARLPQAAVLAPGGSAGNTTFTAARLGLKTSFLGKVGNDTGGEFYRQRFVELGGDGSRFLTGNVPNGRCLSLITPDSSRTLRTDLGAAMTLSPEEVSSDAFRNCRHAHIEGYLLFNHALMMSVLDAAKSAGCSVSLDLASFEVVEATKDVLPSILKDYVDVVFGNEDECAQLFGADRSFEEMAATLAEWCGGVAAVKLGPEGSILAQRDQLFRVEPVRVDKPVDTTGAGDIWAAGFLYGWLRGKDLVTCGRYASHLGAEVVQIDGATIPNDRWDALAGIFRD